MARVYSQFDPANVGSNLSVEQGGELLVIDAASQNINRTGRGDLGVTGGVHYFETQVYGTEDALTNRASVGVITGSASLATYVGGDAYGVGYRIAEGQIHVGGSSVASVTAGVEGDIVGVLLDLEGETVTFYLNGVAIHTEDISDSAFDGESWYTGASLGSGTAADLKCFLNTGQRGFEYPSPLAEGWYSIPVTIDTVWIGTEDYTTGPDDSPPNQPIDGVIPDGATSFAIERSLMFWPQGDGAVARPSVASIDITNEQLPDGSHRFDELVDDIRDLPVLIYEGDRDETFDYWDSLGSFIVDRSEVLDDQAIRLTLKDNTARLDEPLQNRLFLPNAEGNAANRPIPITLGACFSIPPVLYDDANLLYALSDVSLLGIGDVRDKGDPLDPFASTPDYTIIEGFTGIQLANEPAGKLTVDVSSVGGDTISEPPNLITFDSSGYPEFDAEFNLTYTGGYVRFDDSGASPQTAGALEAYGQINGLIESGKTYRLTYTVPAITDGLIGLGQKVYLDIGFNSTRSNVFGALAQSLQTMPKSGTVTFTNFSGSTYNLLFRMWGTQSTTDQARLTASTLSLIEVDEEPLDSDNLLGIGLADYIEAILQDRAGFAASTWSRADAEAIDTASGDAEVGFHTQEQITVREALEAVLPSFTACMAQDASGVWRVFRLEAPEDFASDVEGTIDDSVILKPGLKVMPDEAPGLTTRFACQRNELVLDPTDFVDDYGSTGVSLSVRRRLSRQYRQVVATGGSLAAAYSHARGADPHPTRLIRVADAQAECDRIRVIYSTLRRFFVADVPLEDAGTYEIGQYWNLEYPRYGLDSGKTVRIHKIKLNRVTGRATLTFWG